MKKRKIREWLEWFETLFDRTEELEAKTTSVLQNFVDLRYDLGSRIAKLEDTLEDTGPMARLTTAVNDSLNISQRMRAAVDRVESLDSNIRSANARIDALQNASPVLELQKRVKALEESLAMVSKSEGELRLRVAKLEPRIEPHPLAGGGSSNQGGRTGA